jgi:hypothetical protein
MNWTLKRTYLPEVTIGTLKPKRIGSGGVITHGYAIGKKSAEYRAWQRMKGRCSDKSNNRYEYYGGRGIKVCDEWLKFENFIADMGDRPSSDHSLDRINVDGNYEPNNCRWATRNEQANNKRSNHLITYEGQTLNITKWSLLTGINRATLHLRLKKGWPMERVFGERYARV